MATRKQKRGASDGRKAKPADKRDESWHESLRKALGKKKPEGGWPKPPKKPADEPDEG